MAIIWISNIYWMPFCLSGTVLIYFHPPNNLWGRDYNNPHFTMMILRWGEGKELFQGHIQLEESRHIERCSSTWNIPYEWYKVLCEFREQKNNIQKTLSVKVSIMWWAVTVCLPISPAFGDQHPLTLEELCPFHCGVPALWLLALPQTGPESLGVWGLEPREETFLLAGKAVKSYLRCAWLVLSPGEGAGLW